MDGAAADWLGIDFGTCYSSAARVVDGRAVLVKEPLRHGFSVPSSVLMTGEGSGDGIVVGVAAESQKMLHLNRFASEFKRVLGRREPVTLGTRDLEVTDLVAEVLAFLRGEAEKAAGHDLRKVVVTIPASYEGRLCELTEQAARQAGFDRVELLEEPVAALIAHRGNANGAGADDRLVMVYDLGGGTFDCALVEVGGDGYRVLRADGVDDVGGADFDAAIAQDLAAQAGEVLRDSLAGLASADDAERLNALRAQQLAREHCRNVKHDLSSMPEAGTSFLLPAGPVHYVLTRDRLAELVRGALDRTVDCCRDLLEAADRTWADVDGILMVGGSCRLPFVEDRLAAESGRPVWHEVDPEFAVCEGAALHAAELAEPAVRDLVVDPGGDGDHKTIAAAVKDAAPGARITIRPGDYSGRVVVDKALTLVGDGFRNKIVLSGKQGPVLRCEAAGVRVSGLTLRADKGSVVDVREGDAEVESCHIEPAGGRGVWVRSAALTMRGNRVEDPAHSEATAPGSEPAQEPPKRADTYGVVAEEGARMTLVHNEVVGMSIAGLMVAGEGTTAVSRDDEITGTGGNAVLLTRGAGMTLEGCEVDGSGGAAAVHADGAGTRLTLHAGRIRQGAADGIVVQRGAAATIADTELEDCARAAVKVTESGSATLRGNRLSGGLHGVVVAMGSTATLVQNRIAGSTSNAVHLAGEGTVAELAGDRIDSAGVAGVHVERQAAAQLLDVEIRDCATGLHAEGADCEIRAERTVVADSAGTGVLIENSARIHLGHSEVSGCQTGVAIDGSNGWGSISHNKITGAATAGVTVSGARHVRLRHNEVTGNGHGASFDSEAAPELERNRIVDNRLCGVTVDGAAPRMHENRIAGNGQRGIVFTGVDGRELTDIVRNEFAENAFGAFGGTLPAAIGRNDLDGLAKQSDGSVRPVAKLVEDGRFAEADAACMAMIREKGGHERIVTTQQAAAVPTDLLEALDAVWAAATGQHMRARPFAIDEAVGLTAKAFINTYLEKRLKQLGL